MLQLIAIKTKSNVYISTDIKHIRGYGVNYIKDYIFDGEKPQQTFRENWYELNKIPTTIKKFIPAKKLIKYWKLKEGYFSTEKLPETINVEYDITYEDEQNDYLHVSALYEPVYNIIEECYENIPFEISIIQEFEGEFKFIEQQYKVEYDFLSTLNTHPAILELKPCKLSCAESYKIIRDHVKANIDLKVSRIRSDYDFCFGVEKVIPVEPKPYQVTVGTGKRAKTNTKYRLNREITVFECAPKSYQSYTVVKPFEGSSYQNMLDNINNYLEDIMAEINKPLIDCPHCKGMGVI